MSRFDVAIIGAGPAGMAAAIEASQAGLACVVLDEQSSPGGQIYRSVEKSDAARGKILGKDYGVGRELAKSFRKRAVTYLAGASVWHVGRDLTIYYSTAAGSASVSASAIVVATGAIERPTPLPGWTLPGVITAGACQILLKAHSLVDDDVVFVGSGPLVWLIAAQMVAAGTLPRAIVETIPSSRYPRAIASLRPSASTAKYLRKGLAMMLAVRRAKVPVFRGATDVAINGTHQADGVSFLAGGKSHVLRANRIALHQGVVPNQQITRVLRCEHSWSASQRAFLPVLDPFGETTVPNIFVAGDGSGIGGARVAELQGRIVGLRVAEKNGRKRDGRVVALRAELAGELAIRPFLERLYAPSDQIIEPADGTMVCRCEEITAGEIRCAVDAGASDPNQVKSLLRNGMGPCQGRMCGLAVTEIVSRRLEVPPAEVDYYRIRAPLKPLALTELAAFNSSAPASALLERKA